MAANTGFMHMGGPVGAVFLALQEPLPIVELRKALERFGAAEWHRFADLAIVRHRIGPLVYAALRAVGWDAVPVPIGARFAAEARRAAHHALSLKAETARLVAALNERGIEPVLLKGWALEEGLGHPLGRRVARDLDLMVAPAELRASCETAAALGYSLVTAPLPESDNALAAFLIGNKEFELGSADTDVRIELPVRPFASARLLPRHLLRTEQRVLRIGETLARFRVLTRTSCFLYLALHGYLHCWTRGKWLADMPRLIRDLTPEEWLRISARARELGIERAVGTALVLCRDLLGVSPPPAAEPLAAAAERARVTAICRRRVTAEQDPLERPGIRAGLEIDYVCLAASRHWRTLAEALIVRLVQANDSAAWRLVGLPRSLYLTLAVLYLGRRAGRRLLRDIAQRPSIQSPQR